MAYEPIETPEQVEAACKHAEERIAEARALIGAITPATPPLIREAIISACAVTAARLREVPTPGHDDGGTRGYEPGRR